jgi:leucyl-tRNA synthetase
MIQGSSRIIFIIDFIGYKGGIIGYGAAKENRLHTSPVAVSYDLIEDYIDGGDVSISELFQRLSPYSFNLSGLDLQYNFTTASAVGRHVNIKLVDGIVLNIDEFKKERKEFSDVEFIYDKTKGFICKPEVEKMSKSKLNVENPDDIVVKYGADTFRMYEMFLGPVEMSKPWDTKGIEGVHRFLKKLWRLFYDDVKGPIWTAVAPSPSERAGGEATEAELKVLHKTIKKIEDDTERFSFNTGVSTFMIAVNELTDLKCHKKEVLEKLLILLTPYAPHISEELWQQLSNEGSILNASYPKLEEKYLLESSKEYPISVNGKLRTTINIALGAAESEVEQIVLANEIIQKWLEGKKPKKIIYKEGKMVNVVV